MLRSLVGSEMCIRDRAKAYLRTNWYPDTYSRLATIDTGQKLGAVRFFFFFLGGGLLCHFRGSWDPVYYIAARAEVYFRTKWRLNPSSRLAAIDMGQNLGALPLLGVGAWSPSNTKSPGLRPTFIPSGISIYAAICPQRILAEIWGDCAPLGGELGPHLTQCRQGRGLPACQVSS